MRPRAQVVFRRIRSHPMTDLEPRASMMTDLSFYTWSILHTVLHVFYYHDNPDGISTLCGCLVTSECAHARRVPGSIPGDSNVYSVFNLLFSVDQPRSTYS